LPGDPQLRAQPRRTQDAGLARAHDPRERRLVVRTEHLELDPRIVVKLPGNAITRLNSWCTSGCASSICSDSTMTLGSRNDASNAGKPGYTGGLMAQCRTRSTFTTGGKCRPRSY